ncbi:MAG: TetR/AcrR family transcriptional regulator [Oricola sp.]
MKDRHEPPRAYRSPLRAAQAQQTRQSILDAARALFITKGWVGTTIAAIAADASVSNETVYSVFGAKRAILQTLISDAVRGHSPDVPLLQQETPSAIAAATDPRRQIALFARDIAGVLSRVAPLMAVLRAAAETEPKLAGLYRQIHEGRRANLAFVAEALVRNGPLREGMDVNAATATIWRLASPDLFLLMRDVEGVDGDGYATWLEQSLVALLLPS